MANIKTLPDALKINKSILEKFTIFSIPAITVVTLTGGCFIIGDKTSWYFAIPVYLLLIFSAHNIFRKNPNAIKNYLNLLTVGDTSLTPFKKTNKRIVIKKIDGTYDFLNK